MTIAVTRSTGTVVAAIGCAPLIRYRAFVRSSCADYLAEWLLDAMTEYVEEVA